MVKYTTVTDNCVMGDVRYQLCYGWCTLLIVLWVMYVINCVMGDVRYSLC